MMIRKARRKYGSLLLAAILAGCAAGQGGSGGGGYGGSGQQDDTGAVISDISPPRERARIHTELAGAYFERGNLVVSLEEVRIAVNADPNYAPAYNVLGLVQMDMKEYPQAQSSFERALSINPNDPDTNHNYGWFLCQTGREDQSVRYFLAAIKNPLYATPQKSYALAGVCALRKNKEQDAVEYFERALKLDPNSPQALTNLAQVKYRQGVLGEARDLIGRYLRQYDPNPEAVWLALRIERRFGDKAAENNYASQLRQQFAGSKEYQDLLKGNYD